jgi:hypothetical protein
VSVVEGMAGRGESAAGVVTSAVVDGRVSVVERMIVGGGSTVVTGALDTVDVGVSGGGELTEVGCSTDDESPADDIVASVVVVGSSAVGGATVVGCSVTVGVTVTDVESTLCNRHRNTVSTCVYKAQVHRSQAAVSRSLSSCTTTAAPVTPYPVPQTHVGVSLGEAGGSLRRGPGIGSA